MKKLLTLFLLFISLLPKNKAQNNPFPCPADTLQALQWEYLSGPPARVTAFAQCRNRVFAATDLGLFYRDNTAAAWTLQPETRGFKIENLFANDSVVLFQYNRTQALAPHTGIPTKYLNVYRSLDQGQHFDVIYVLDGDSEYFGSVLFPYVITPFYDLGGGFLYFEHGLPYPGFGSANPYENARYFSPDYGKNWYREYVSYSGMKAPLSKVFQNLSACQDTLLGIQITTDNQGNWTLHANLYPDLGFQNAGLADSVQNLDLQLSNYQPVYYRQNLYFIRLGFNQFKSTIARLPGISTPDFGTEIFIDTLYFPNEPNMQPKKCWNTDTSLWFEFQNGNTYRSDLSNPTDISFQFKKIIPPAFAKTFAALPSGWYANNALYETLFSEDAGLNWQKAYAGLSTDLVGLGSDQCGQIMAGPHKSDLPAPYKYYRYLPDGQWEYIDSTREKSLYWKTGVAFDALYMNNESKVYRSEACEHPLSWNLTGLVPAGWGDTIIMSGGRAYSYRRNWVGGKTYVSTDGLNWQDAGFYCLGNLSINGDTLVTWRENQAGVSLDFGSSWTNFYFPSNFYFSWVVFDHTRFLALDQSQNSLQWFVCKDFTHADNLNNWAPAGCAIHRDSTAYAVFGDALIPAAMAAYTSDLLFLHALGGLYLSNDASQTWHRLPSLPFTNEYAKAHSVSGQIQYGEAEGAASYHVADGYLYAFTEKQGVWRSELQPLLAQLPPPVVETYQPENPAEILRLYPNPASTAIQIDLPTGFAADKVVIYNAMMQPVFAQAWTTERQVQVEALCPGMYTIGVFDGNGRAVFGKFIHLQ